MTDTSIVTDDMVLAYVKATRPDLWDPETGEVVNGSMSGDHMEAMHLAKLGLDAAVTEQALLSGSQLSDVLFRAARVAQAQERMLSEHSKEPQLRDARQKLGEAERRLAEERAKSRDLQVKVSAYDEDRRFERQRAAVAEAELARVNGPVNADPFVDAIELLRERASVRREVSPRGVVEHVLREFPSLPELVRGVRRLVAHLPIGSQASPLEVVEEARKTLRAQALAMTDLQNARDLMRQRIAKLTGDVAAADAKTRTAEAHATRLLGELAAERELAKQRDEADRGPSPAEQFFSVPTRSADGGEVVADLARQRRRLTAERDHLAQLIERLSTVLSLKGTTPAAVIEHAVGLFGELKAERSKGQPEDPTEKFGQDLLDGLGKIGDDLFDEFARPVSRLMDRIFGEDEK